MSTQLKTILLLAMIFGILSTPTIIYGQEKLALLIIAHGSPMSQWNTHVLKLEEKVKKIIFEKRNSRFTDVRVALMEFCEPTISTVIKGFEKAGIKRVFAIPLFIAPSEHSLYDVPTILGLYSDKRMIENIKEEGITIVDTKIKVTVGPTLNIGDVLKEIMLDRVKEFSTDPDSEGMILLAHGSASFEPIWSSMCKKIGFYICARTGISYFDYAFVEVGQSFITEGVPVILGAAGRCKKTIVIGLYLSMGVDNMAQNSVLRIGKMKIESKKIFVDKNVYFAKRGLLPDKRISEWIVDRALEYAEGLK